jgi:hypothetical protein
MLELTFVKGAYGRNVYVCTMLQGIITLEFDVNGKVTFRKIQQ